MLPSSQVSNPSPKSLLLRSSGGVAENRTGHISIKLLCLPKKLSTRYFFHLQCVASGFYGVSDI